MLKASNFYLVNTCFQIDDEQVFLGYMVYIHLALDNQV